MEAGYVRYATAVLVVYAADDPAPPAYWVGEAAREGKPVALVANKCDRAAPLHAEWAAQQGLAHYACSAHTGEGVRDALRAIIARDGDDKEREPPPSAASTYARSWWCCG